MRLPLAMTLMLAACGPKYHFTDGPTPPWVNQVTANQGSGNLQAIGMSPLTSNVQHDTEMATRDAKSKIAQMFVSEVDSRLTVWNMAMDVNGEQSNANAVQKNTAIRSKVRVEDTRVIASFRDKSTMQQYVQLGVDQSRWMGKLQTRIGSKLKEMQSAVNEASAAKKDGRAFFALQSISKGYQHGKKLEPDALVMGILSPGHKSSEAFTELKSQLFTMRKAIISEHPFQLDISAGPDGKWTLRNQVADYLKKELGATVLAAGQSQPNAIKIAISYGQTQIKRERVGRRIEFVHAANGAIKAQEPNGSDIPALSYFLPEKTNIVRAKTPKEGAQQGAQLAADTLNSKFRSLYRRAMK